MAYTQGFRATAEHTYRSVRVDLLKGHIHEFQAQVIAIPIPANNRVFASFNAAQIRANESMKLSVAQRVYEAAGDSDGTGQRSQKVRQGAFRSTAEREGTAKLTGSYNLAPGVKSIIHAYHPKLPDNGSKEALDTYVKELVDVYRSILVEIADPVAYKRDVIIAISPLIAAPTDRCFAQCNISPNLSLGFTRRELWKNFFGI
ncbi:hypothetical protein WAI453_010462 [Rhynchosporium graminicola]